VAWFQLNSVVRRNDDRRARRKGLIVAIYGVLALLLTVIYVSANISPRHSASQGHSRATSTNIAEQGPMADLGTGTGTVGARARSQASPVCSSVGARSCGGPRW
jgi:hypothetical protein